MRRSPMGLGAVALGLIAWAMVLIGLTLHTPHMMATVGFMIALSGAAVAWEGRRVEEDVAPALQRWGFWVNVGALAAAGAAITVEIVRR